MKKFSALVIICLTAVMLSACSAFYDDQTQNYTQDNPYTTTVFLKLKEDVTFAPDLLANWKADVERIITATTGVETAKITAVNCDTKFSTTVSAYPVELTLANVPDTTTRKVVRPFKIYYTQTIYNPIALLPASEHFVYFVGYTFERRHSSANTKLISQDETGDYTYLWTTSEPIQVQNIYPNRPLYYVIIIGIVILVGVAVYGVSRYIDCKKRKMSL